MYSVEGFYDCKPPDHEGVARGRGVVYSHKPPRHCALTDPSDWLIGCYASTPLRKIVSPSLQLHCKQKEKRHRQPLLCQDRRAKVKLLIIATPINCLLAFSMNTELNTGLVQWARLSLSPSPLPLASNSVSKAAPISIPPQPSDTLHILLQTNTAEFSKNKFTDYNQRLYVFIHDILFLMQNISFTFIHLDWKHHYCNFTVYAWGDNLRAIFSL